MRCPTCSSQETKVIDSRILQEGTSTRRRRKCESCDHRFTTYEYVQNQFPALVKSDGRRENYNRQKILKGLNKACQKRPISTDQIEALVEALERELLENEAKEIKSKKVGTILMKLLLKLDKVSYVRFASFYWNFDDIESFISSLQKSSKITKSSKMIAHLKGGSSEIH